MLGDPGLLSGFGWCRRAPAPERSRDVPAGNRRSRILVPMARLVEIAQALRSRGQDKAKHRLAVGGIRLRGLARPFLGGGEVGSHRGVGGEQIRCGAGRRPRRPGQAMNDSVASSAWAST